MKRVEECVFTLSGMSVLVVFFVIAWNTLNEIAEVTVNNIINGSNLSVVVYVAIIGVVWGYFSGRRWEKEAWRECIKTHTNNVNWSNGYKVSTKHHECAHSVVDHIYDIRKFEVEYSNIREYGEKVSLNWI